MEEKEITFNINDYPKKRNRFEILILNLSVRFMNWFWHVEASGIENIPTDENCIICSNHQSTLDVYFLMNYLNKAYRKKVFVFCRKEAWAYFSYRFSLKFVQGVPIDREGDARPSLKKAKQLLKEGQVLIIFPEGTRTKTGEVQEIKEGAAWLAKATGTKILPVHMEGFYEAWPFHPKARFKDERKAHITYRPVIETENATIKELTQMIYKGIQKDVD